MTYNLKILKVILIIITITSSSSCGIYSFSGTSVPEGTKSFYVHYIKNTANLIQPTLSNNFTEALKTKCLNETNLSWQEENPDISFSGTIKNYSIQPMSIQNNETAAQNRLTIEVEITYSNQIDNSQNFNQIFNQYADFDSSQNFSAIEEELNNTIIENLIDDIFNKSLVNW